MKFIWDIDINIDHVSHLFFLKNKLNMENKFTKLF